MCTMDEVKRKIAICAVPDWRFCNFEKIREAQEAVDKYVAMIQSEADEKVKEATALELMYKLALQKSHDREFQLQAELDKLKESKDD